MSFLKIKDPLKREQTIKEYLELKKRIHDKQLAEKEGRHKYQQQLSRFFKPVIDLQKETSKEIVKKLGFNNINKLTTKLDEFPTLIVFEEVKLGDEENEEIGNFFDLLDLKGYDDHISKIIASPFEISQLKRFKNKDEVDLIYGFYVENKKLLIGDKKVDILNDSFYIDDKYEYEYKGTPGLWELIVASEPKKIYTEIDLENYKKIMLFSNNLYKNNDPNIDLPKERRSYKWRNFLSLFWKERKTPLFASPIRGNEESNYPYYSPYYLGKGITIIPSDPNALLERFDLLMASKGAGHTGVRNELVSICDELKRQRILDTKSYKKLMSKI